MEINQKNYVDIKDVKEITTNIKIVKCTCGAEHQSFFGLSGEIYLDIARRKGWAPNISVNKRDILFFCNECGHIYTKEELDAGNLWVNREELALICPKCNFIVSQTSENKSEIGYICPECGGILEYTANPTHGSGKVKVKNTTDYFHGICPNCITEDGSYGAMILQGEIFVGESNEVKGRLSLPLECQRCGYRDAVKIAMDSGSGKGIVITKQ